METHEKSTPIKDLFLRAIAVLGLIAVLLLGAWGIIQLAFALPSIFDDIGTSISSLFNHNTNTPAAVSSKETLTVTLPSSVTSGSSLAVSWMHQNADTSGQYSYAISYACQDGLSVKAPLPTGSYQVVPCNTLFNYVNASQHMSVIPTITGSATIPLTVSVVATKLSTGQVTSSGTATISVTPNTTKTTTATTHTSTTRSTTYYPAARRATSLYGYGDLAVHFTSVAPSASRATITFVIENDGTNVVPAGWTFTANLPIQGSYSFGSQPQQTLYPGDKIAYTLSFAGINRATYPVYSNGYNNSYGYSYPNTSGYNISGYNCNGYNCINNYTQPTSYPTYGYGASNQSATITITADPQNYVPEYNKGNNIAQTTIPLY